MHEKQLAKFISPYNCFMPLVHGTGAAQADFFECTFYEKNSLINGYGLILSFPQSNAAFCQLYKGRACECLLHGLKSIFEHTNGVPHTIWFDNDTSIVRIKDGKEKEINEHFLRFKNHYNFRAKFCNIRAANEKGNVEVNVKTLRNNLLVPLPRFENIDDYNKKLLLECENLLNRKHYIEMQNISNLFVYDKHALLALPTIDLKQLRK